MNESGGSGGESSATTTSSLPQSARGTGGGSAFGQRRADIYKRLKLSAAECRSRYSGRKELATERDDAVAELCEALEDTFSYGLKQPQPAFVITAASLFQNMQEIVKGNMTSATDAYFWDFCQTHLTTHERERYERLNHVWTKCGRGRAFIRATLNEHSLQRYVLTWLSASETLCLYYTPWSLLLDEAICSTVPDIIGSLDDILFALSVDKTELNVATRTSRVSSSAAKEEPIIYAPTPVPVGGKSKRKTNAIERPIASSNSTEDLLSVLQEVSGGREQPNVRREEYVNAVEELLAPLDDTPPPDPIEPELEFLKRPLSDFCLAEEESVGMHIDNSSPDQTNPSNKNEEHEHEYEDKSDTSSQYSKCSSSITNGVNNSNCLDTNHLALEQQLREANERCALLETSVARLSLENRQLVRRLKQLFEKSGIDPSSSLATNFLISIPHVKLQKSKPAGSSYYTYEIHITMRQNLEHWSLCRRYSEFYKLHKSLLRTHPSVSSVEFPPKKHFGNMNLLFVEERRQQLQIYLLNLVETLPQLEACKSKAELQKVFPFLRDR